MKIELNEVFQSRLDRIFVREFIEVAQARRIVDGFQLRIAVNTLLRREKSGIAHIAGEDFDFPGRRNDWLWRRHLDRQWISKIVVSKGVANQHGEGVRLLSRGAVRAPDTQTPVAIRLFPVQDLLEDRFLEEFKLGFGPKETCFVDDQIVQQRGQFGFALPAGQESIVAIEGIRLADFQPPLHAVAQKVDAALIKKHATFLIDQSLQEFYFCIGRGNGLEYGWCGHGSPALGMPIST